MNAAKDIPLLDYSSPIYSQGTLRYGIIMWMIVLHILGVMSFFYISKGAFITFLVLYFVTSCLGITMGFHRLLSHRSFKAPIWVERALGLIGTLALQGTVAEWVFHHRMHHSFTDTEEDPHNARRGFWHSHMGWMLQYREHFEDERKKKVFARDIWRDPFFAFISKPTVMIGMQVTLGLALLLWGGFDYLLWGVFFRLMFVYHVTWLVNSATHKWGYVTTPSSDLAKNNWWVAILSFGEGWHNNHHAVPKRCRAGVKWWEIDITYYLICLMQRIGWARDIHP